MSARDVPPTRIARLELGEEQATAREGFALLDEKRTLLASRILRLLERHEEGWRQWHARRTRAEAALASALDRHGVRGLEWRDYPRCAREYVRADRRALGVRWPEMEPVAGDARPTLVDAETSAELAAAIDAWRELAELAPGLAARECALWRLADEYRRTERRASAIEHLLLPELAREIAEVEGALEAVDEEEAQRVRRARSGIAGDGAHRLEEECPGARE